MRLIGKVAPYDVTSAGVTSVVRGVGLHVNISSGALSDLALDGIGTEFRVDHDDLVPGGKVVFVTMRAGLYATISFPDSPQARSIMHARDRWSGLSIKLQHAHAQSVTNWSDQTVYVERINLVEEISLCVDEAPAFAGTWVATDRAAATERMRLEEDAALQRIFGPNYKATRPSSWWALPKQHAQLEAQLCARDATRAAREQRERRELAMYNFGILVP